MYLNPLVNHRSYFYNQQNLRVAITSRYTPKSERARKDTMSRPTARKAAPKGEYIETVGGYDSSASTRSQLIRSQIVYPYISYHCSVEFPTVSLLDGLRA